MKDDEILPLLQRTRRATFFTRDSGFYEARNCSANYCVVCLAVGQQEVAVFVRDILRHSELNTQAKRMGKVIRVTQTGIRIWQMSGTDEIRLDWTIAVSG